MARPIYGFQNIWKRSCDLGLILTKKYNVSDLKHYVQEESDDTSSNAIRSSDFWSDPPGEIAKMILLYALQ